MVSSNKEQYKEEFLKMLYEHNNKEIELGKRYYVSQWSMHPISNGYVPYETCIRQVVNVDGIKCYFSMISNRYYQAYQIHETQEEAQHVADFMNRFGYDSTTVTDKVLAKMGVTIERAEELREEFINDSLKRKGYFAWY